MEKNEWGAGWALLTAEQDAFAYLGVVYLGKPMPSENARAS